nr:MAG TPA: tail tube protein [Caudoviricetes sp.]
MAALVWDKTGERRIETGVDHCALYVYDPNTKTYGKGVAWNGITAISEKPEGAEATDLYADNILYLSLLSAEKLKGTIEAYTYPDEFEACDGSAELTKGVKIGQQDRVAFGLVYRTKIGDDVAGQDRGYKLHVLYGCKASPSEKGYKTVNDSPEAISFSWEISTTPVNVAGAKPTSLLTISSLDVDATKLKALEAKLFGVDAQGGQQAAEPKLLLPDEIKAHFAG